MRYLLIFTVCNLIFWEYTASAQVLSLEEIQHKSKEKLPEALSTFQEFLAMPNDGHFPAQIATNLAWCDRKFTSIGFKTQKIVSNGVPHLYAEKIVDEKKKNILFYLQIDGQPVDSTKWDQESPFAATIKDENGNVIPWGKLGNSPDENLKIYARSASDSKGPATCFISALELMNEMKLSSDFNIKVIMDFQEEMSSPTIADLVNKNRELLNADYLLIMDGTRHISNLPTLTFGARGIATITLTVFGAKEDLHSGQYGNYAPNPAFKLARLLATMKDDEGRVLIDGYYDGIKISEADKVYFDKVPEDMNALNKRLGIVRSEAVAEGYQATMQYPRP